MDKPLIAITHGDTNGIGYELILKAFAEPEILEVVTPVVYGTKMIAAIYAEQLQIDCKFNVVNSAAEAMPNRINLVEVSENSVPVNVGKPTAESSAMASKALGRALAEFAEGYFDKLVLAPSNEDELHTIIDSVKGAGEGTAVNLMPIDIVGNDNVSVSSIAGRTTAEKAMQTISVEDIVERATTLRNALRRDMRIDNPRIAIISLGAEKDEQMVKPATETLRSNKVAAFGPYTVKEMFEDGAFVHFDGVLGAYHDQVVRPFVEMYGETGVNVISGLPIVITRPVQGPSFAMAGKSIADETSMRNALYQAIDISRSRYYYDLPLANPLKKIYHERREDGDKARFAVKRDFNKGAN